jgi:hypothetical protein
MRGLRILLLCLPLVSLAGDVDFSGVWRLNESRSQIRALPIRPAPELRVAAKDGSVSCEALTPGQPPHPCSFATDGREIRSKGRDWTVSTKAKWEGAALLLNSINTAPQRQHTEMDRWKLSRDGKTLTIRRVVVSISSGEIESTLVYEKQP